MRERKQFLKILENLKKMEITSEKLRRQKRDSLKVIHRSMYSSH